MKDGLQGDKIDFTLTESAQEYLSKTLADWVKQTSEKGLVPILSYAGEGRSEKDGKIIWEYRGGALFLLANQRREALQSGRYFNLLGFSVWIGDIDQLFLKGRVLTFMGVGAPEPRKHLVIENAPENFFQTVLRENARCRLRDRPNLEHGRKN
jgi:hypothetical protein